MKRAGGEEQDRKDVQEEASESILTNTVRLPPAQHAKARKRKGRLIQTSSTTTAAPARITEVQRYACRRKYLTKFIDELQKEDSSFPTQTYTNERMIAEALFSRYPSLFQGEKPRHGRHEAIKSLDNAEKLLRQKRRDELCEMIQKGPPLKISEELDKLKQNERSYSTVIAAEKAYLTRVIGIFGGLTRKAASAIVCESLPRSRWIVDRNKEKNLDAAIQALENSRVDQYEQQCCALKMEKNFQRKTRLQTGQNSAPGKK